LNVNLVPVLIYEREIEYIDDFAFIIIQSDLSSILFPRYLAFPLWNWLF